MSLEKMRKGRWHQARNENEQSTGIHGNPESGNHPGTVTLIESVEILTNPHTFPDQ